MYKEIHLWLQTVNLEPLGIINKNMRVSTQKQSKRWRVLVSIALVYLVLVVALIAKAEFQAATTIQKILSPVLFALNLIKG